VKDIHGPTLSIVRIAMTRTHREDETDRRLAGEEAERQQEIFTVHACIIFDHRGEPDPHYLQSKALS